MKQVAGNEIRLFIHENKGAAGQVINIIQIGYFFTCIVNSFIVQDGINLLYGSFFSELICRFSFELIHFKTVMILPSAFTAGAVAGRKSSSFIKKKQPGI